MYISGIKSELNNHHITISCEVQSEHLPSSLIYDVSGHGYENIALNKYNHALCGLIYPAMFFGEDIVIDGCVSERLLAAMGDLQAFLRVFDPRLRPVSILSTSTDTARRARSGRVATGFSAGIDSHATIALYNGSRMPMILTDLCTFDVGAMGFFGERSTSELFRQYRDRTAAFAQRSKLHCMSVQSNLDSFYPHPLYFHKTHTLRNISAAMIFEDRLDYYLYSSGLAPPDIGIRRSHDISCTDPVILPLLSTENMAFISAGAGLSRFQKTALVAGQAVAKDTLDVCVDTASHKVSASHINCSKCWKCKRTMVSLDVIGKIDDFASVFNLDYFRANRKQFYEAILVSAMSGSVLDREVVAEARKAGKPVRRRPAIIAKFLISRLKAALKNRAKSSRLITGLYRRSSLRAG